MKPFIPTPYRYSCIKNWVRGAETKNTEPVTTESRDGRDSGDTAHSRSPSRIRKYKSIIKRIHRIIENIAQHSDSHEDELQGTARTSCTSPRSRTPGAPRTPLARGVAVIQIHRHRRQCRAMNQTTLRGPWQGEPTARCCQPRRNRHSRALSNQLSFGWQTSRGQL